MLYMYSFLCLQHQHLDLLTSAFEDKCFDARLIGNYDLSQSVVISISKSTNPEPNFTVPARRRSCSANRTSAPSPWLHSLAVTLDAKCFRDRSYPYIHLRDLFANKHKWKQCTCAGNRSQSKPNVSE
jgi:hypothetical protein